MFDYVATLYTQTRSGRNIAIEQLQSDNEITQSRANEWVQRAARERGLDVALLFYIIGDSEARFHNTTS